MLHFPFFLQNKSFFDELNAFVLLSPALTQVTLCLYSYHTNKVISVNGANIEPFENLVHKNFNLKPQLM